MLSLRGIKVALLLARSDSFLRTSGWVKSILTQRPVDAAGDPIPWLAYPAVAFLEGRVADGYITKETRVFEYGAGYSTAWWRRQSRCVDSVEHDQRWASRVEHLLDITSGVKICSDEDGYVNAIGDGPYDIVVVDGRWRPRCLLRAVPSLSDRGVIILDNADRAEYQSTVGALVKQGFRRIDFTGPAPGNHYAHSTAVLYRDGNCLGV